MTGSRLRSKQAGENYISCTINRLQSMKYVFPLAYIITSFALLGLGVGHGNGDVCFLLISLPFSLVVWLCPHISVVVLLLVSSIQYVLLGLYVDRRIARWKQNRIMRQPRHIKCLHCGYSLRGLRADVCPECGKNIYDYKRGVPASCANTPSAVNKL